MRNTALKLMDQRLKTSIVRNFIEVHLIDKLKFEFSFQVITRNCKSNTLKNAL